MKHIAFLMISAVFLSAGFFNDEAKEEAAQKLENERLCKLFTKKVAEYKKTMRHDMLAKTTLASYEHRKSLFCAKVNGEENSSTE